MVQKSDEGSTARGRGRPRQYDPDAALDKAMGAFWQGGYAATSLDDLSVATGMNRPSLYAGLGDKRDIYLKTLQRYRDLSRAMVVALLAENLTLRVFLQRFYESALDLYLAGPDGARGCYSVSTAGTQAAVDPVVRDFLAGSIAGTDKLMCDQIRKARERGEIAESADPESLGQLATATLHTLAVRSRAGAPREQLTALAASAIRLICG